MIKVTYVAQDGTATTIEAEEGTSVMQAAVSNDLDGIVGECGGSMMCATCHCYVDEAWAERTGERSSDEEEMLEGAADEVTERSRLSCQIRLQPGLDGLVVHLPEEQL
ncbi:2Fe-2S iron-sulfur cluster binding domain-containing protein [Yangia mangrovi]|uniref:(2Fe-2S)-binding protein n=1 Tax=Alloyangia mangrovi TaxID=1779329 RepID=A0A2A3JWK5_9RHOB|nr:2Fe-2S iron-sulfur cluster-binding protein [Alloyangia mangrovi]MCA0942167.1 2Fe-2S iron-sulfur cluster binding domain-containing protein [Alloyangia pacifica]MCA0947196.1 2Fe-2S iron-sulfur cluster binding domain-containing protein [Alloyangia pacifica]MCT4371032.1 2Fe-2S iron-sulfur cluster binding domain-containing protein [Alloyangia mangrovi]